MSIHAPAGVPATVHVDRSVPAAPAAVHDTVYVDRSTHDFSLSDKVPHVPRDTPALPKPFPSPPKMVKRAGPPPSIPQTDKLPAPVHPVLPPKLPVSPRSTPAVPELPKLPLPKMDKRSSPAMPELPAKLPELPKPVKRDETSPTAKLPVSAPKTAPNPVAMLPHPRRSHDVPEPIEHPPIVRPKFSRDMLAGPFDTAWDALTGGTAGHKNTGSEDTVINRPAAISAVDMNSDPLIHTDSQTHRDGDKSDDVAFAGSPLTGGRQPLHSHTEEEPSGKEVKDEDLADEIHEHSESKRHPHHSHTEQEPNGKQMEDVADEQNAGTRRSTMEDDSKHTVSDQVISAPAGTTIHEHKETQ